jgi:hypothetical protein
VTIAIQELSLVKRVETVQVHFTHEGEGLKAQRKTSWIKIDMESYMAEMGLTQNLEDQDIIFNKFFQHDKVQNKLQGKFHNKF